ncbi:hypothetical protein QDW22_gp54 [Microbacterium Phage DirtyBubble]|uniref:hypothetical protein n=1 Tax=Microbacterium Phage DirtyBubble TaxID=2590932 RepID=UPI001187D295|nr:hypothetical protein QDW22_gp54 [Microbacterium Phage DirtyBubble]QDP45072.1 hypothetical protein DIRTYBUBBLE_54 [Microbacterium Phage DirtyBubble]
MSTFTEKLDAALPLPTAGSLPATRTFGMVEEALASDDIDFVKGELQHSRAHYQSLEYMLNNEAAIVKTIVESFPLGDDIAPTPETVEEAVQLTVRVFATEVLMAAYDSAHQIGLPMAIMGLSVQGALQMLYGDLDFSDPERGVVSDDQIAAFIAAGDDED